MKFSTRDRYALRLMIDIARHDTGGYVALKDVARRQDISVKYLEQIVPRLAGAGLLRGVRGPQGGYRLSRPAESCTVGDILRAAGGSLAPVACLEETPNRCPRSAACPAIGFWEGLARTVAAYADGATLKDLLTGDRPFDGVPPFSSDGSGGTDKTEGFRTLPPE